MKDEEITNLVRRIHQELEELQRVLGRIEEGWERSRRSNDDYYLDSIALNLHGFYSGCERIFTQIAESIDGELPRGEDWHRLLLEQMRKEIVHVRPAIISAKIGELLDELRRFRHVVRNVYTHHLDPKRLEKLVKETSQEFPQLRTEISAFAAFLEQ